MFRMLLWAVVPLGVALALGGALADAAETYAGKAVQEADAARWQLAATVAAALLVALANLTLDAGRAQLAIDRRRTSAVKAWWWGVKLLLRRPGAADRGWPAAGGPARRGTAECGGQQCLAVACRFPAGPVDRAGDGMDARCAPVCADVAVGNESLTGVYWWA
jgi:hypothetical protein